MASPLPLPSRNIEPSAARFLFCLVIAEPVLSALHLDWNALVQRGKTAYKEGRYREAERWYTQALQLARLEGCKPSQIAASLSYLGMAYSRQGHNMKAQPLLLEALRILAKGPKSLAEDNYANVLSNLGIVYSNLEQHSAAESCFLRALALKPEKSDAGRSRTLESLAVVYHDQNRLEEAEATLQEARRFIGREYGPETSNIARWYNNMGAVYHKQQKWEEAEQCFIKAVTLYTTRFGPNHPGVATAFHNWAMLKADRQEFTAAVELWRRVIAIRSEVFGVCSNRLRQPLTRYARLLRQLERNAEAETIEARLHTLDADR